jgi:hypothetical protein
MKMTINEIKAKLLEELRLSIYLRKSFEKPTAYELGREDNTRHVLNLLGYERSKLGEVKDIDELMKAGRG